MTRKSESEGPKGRPSPKRNRQEPIKMSSNFHMKSTIHKKIKSLKSRSSLPWEILLPYAPVALDNFGKQLSLPHNSKAHHVDVEKKPVIYVHGEMLWTYFFGFDTVTTKVECFHCFGTQRLSHSLDQEEKAIFLVKINDWLPQKVPDKRAFYLSLRYRLALKKSASHAGLITGTCIMSLLSQPWLESVGLEFAISKVVSSREKESEKGPSRNPGLSVGAIWERSF